MKIQVSEIQRSASISVAKSQIASELFRLLAVNGIDPDDFDVSDPSSHPIFSSMQSASKEKGNESKVPEIEKILELCNAYVMLQNKIDSIT